MANPRHPTRLALYSETGNFYPNELTELDGKLYIIKADGTAVQVNKEVIIKDSNGTIIGRVNPVSGVDISLPEGSTLIDPTGATAGSYGPSANATPDFGETINIPEVTVNNKGLITKITNRVITLPSSASHPDITIDADTTSEATPNYGGTFTAIDSITKDDNGHVTKVNTKTITLKKPSATYTATVDTTWSGSAAPYSKSITVTGITAADTPIIDVVLSATYATAQTQLENFSKIFRAVTGANTITLYANAKTTANISLQIKNV